ncbi:alpha/beta hydrolase [Thermospira aquatica]|uniref:Serine aminopeptidase S33 domain-containing protein n=1 Tax=Thermospira aquatica TaxID=2828656 RepID=A0AAX3BBX1_9SPIR|nr:alpha/beta hydrolase [Thermospira aquatica]URA09764.1 hypothetical protein KDW03_09795 [Thermospira aquatica]
MLGVVVGGVLFCLFILVNETDLWLKWLYRGKGKILISSLEMIHSSPSKRAVLLLHEFSGLPASLRELGEQLYQEGWDVYIPAMPETVEKKEDLSLITAGPLYFLWYERAESVLLHLLAQYECVVVGGASIGGSIALDLAAHYHVKGVFAVASPIRLWGWHYYRPFSRNLVLVFSGWVGFLFPFWRTKASYVSSSEKEKRYGVDGVIWARAIHSQKIALRRLKKQLDHVLNPCLLIQASNDRTVHPNNIYLLMRKLKNASREAVVLDMQWDTVTRHHLLLNHEDVKDEVKERIVFFFKRWGCA